jgi:hypothetical protein
MDQSINTIQGNNLFRESYEIQASLGKMLFSVNTQAGKLKATNAL